MPPLFFACNHNLGMVSYRHGGRNITLKEIDMNQYYISSGEKNKMYTLRVKFTERVYLGYSIGSRMVERDQHVATLANDKERAIAKAQELVGKEFVINFEVGERAKAQEKVQLPFNVVRFGKYFGKTVEEIKEIDPKYLLWVADNFTSAKHQQVIDFIKEVMQEEIADRNSKFAVELALDAEQNLERAVILKEVGDVLVTLPWDFPQNIGKDLIKGDLPKGRGRHLVADMMGKVQGRRNSKKYKAEYKRVEEIIELAEAI